MANGLLGDPTALRGLLQSPSTTDFALALLANSGYSNRRRSLGEIVGTSMLQSRQMAAEQAQQKLREQYMRAQIEAMQQKPQAQEELATIVGEDGKPVYVPRSQAIGKSPWEKPSGTTSLPTTVQEYEIAKSQGYPGTFMDYRRDVAGMSRAPPAPPSYAPQYSIVTSTRPDGTPGLFRFNQRTGEMEDTGSTPPPEKTSPREGTNLRKEFDSQPSVKAYAETLPLLVSARNAPDTGAGDLQLIYTAGKVLDPGSVVREGELLLFQKAGTPLQRLVGEMRFNAAEGGRLSPDARQQILSMLNERVLAYRQGYDRDRQRFSEYATELGVNPRTVVGDHVANAYTPSRAARQAGSSNQYPEGTVIRDRKTGQTKVMRNGEWVSQ